MKMRQLQILCLSILCLLSFLPAQAQLNIPGLSCENPFELTEDFAMDIPSGGSYWLTAWTYDLPIHTRFVIPTAQIYEDEEDPYVLIDFSCTNGVYDDPNIDKLINSANNWGYDVPIRLDFKLVERDVVNNTTTFELEVSEEYRSMMMKNGITYDVKAYVNVILPRRGKVEMVPATEFRECAESALWMKLPDTLDITVNTTDQIYAIPVTEWLNDSVRFRWTGEERAQLWIGSKCDFELDTSDPNVLEREILQPAGEEGCYIDYSSNQLKYMHSHWGDGSGVFYARVLSGQPGQFIVEHKPIEGPMADAIELQLDEPVALEANDPEQVYYFRRTEWRDQTVQFETTSADTIMAYFGKTLDFTTGTRPKNLIDSMSFAMEDGQMVLQLTEHRMNRLTSATSDEFVFVRFASPISTTLTPRLWEVDDCLAKSARVLYPTDREVVYADRLGRNGNLFTLHYDDWTFASNDVLFRWSSITPLELYVAETCDFNLTPTNRYVLYYEHVDPLEAEDRIGTIRLTQDTLRSFADYVGTTGDLYIRINPGGNGTLYVSQTEPVNPPTSLTTTEGGLRVVYGADEIWIETDTAQDLYLYNSVGMLVRRWQQAAGESQPLSDLPQGVYILRGAQDAVRIRR